MIASARARTHVGVNANFPADKRIHGADATHVGHDARATHALPTHVGVNANCPAGSSLGRIRRGARRAA